MSFTTSLRSERNNKNKNGKKNSMLPFFLCVYPYIYRSSYIECLFSSPLSLCVLLLRDVDEASRNLSSVSVEVEDSRCC